MKIYGWVDEHWKRLLMKKQTTKERKRWILPQWVDGSCHCVAVWTDWKKIITPQCALCVCAYTRRDLNDFGFLFLFSRASLQFNHCLPVGVETKHWNRKEKRSQFGQFISFLFHRITAKFLYRNKSAHQPFAFFYCL